MSEYLRKPVTKYLSVACMVLTITIVFQILYPSGYSSEMAPDLDREKTFELPVYVPAPMTSYTNVLERPLFYEDRRLPKLKEVIKEETREPLQLQLAGVAGSGESRIAMLRDTRNNAVIQMLEGMVHRGWTLDRIESSRAVFVYESDIEELMLKPEEYPGRVARR
jgi:hypothetical protein